MLINGSESCGAPPERSSGSNAALSNSTRPHPVTQPIGQRDDADAENVTPQPANLSGVRDANADRPPSLRTGRRIWRDTESDDASSSSLVESSSEEDTPRPLSTSPGSSGMTSYAEGGSTTRVENPLRLPRTTQPMVHSVPDAKLERKPRVSQEYFDAHLPNRSPHNAVMRRDPASLRAILQRDNAQVNARDGKGRTALHLAVEDGQIEIVEALLEARADVNLRAASGATPLMLAAGKGHTAMVSLLLKHGSNQQLVGVAGATPLEMAARHGHLGAVEALLVQEVAFRNTGRMDPINPFIQPLCVAARYGHEAIVRALLAAGAPAAAFNREGRNPLMLALEAGHLNVAAALLPDISASSWVTDAVSSVSVAVNCAGPEALELLLKHDSTVSRRGLNCVPGAAPASRTYRTLSPRAASSRVPPHLQITLATSALLNAAAQGKPGLVEIALRWGGSLTDVDSNRNTALMAALYSADSTVAMTATTDLLLESAIPARRSPDPAVYNSETLIDRLVSRLSQRHLVIQPRFWLGLSIWLCTERRLRYSVVAPLVAGLKQMFEAWPGLSGGPKDDSLPVTPAQKIALCGHTVATLQGLHTLQNDPGVLRMFTGSPPVAPCYILGAKTAKSLMEGSKAQAQGLVELGARTFGRADLSRIARELAGPGGHNRREILIALCDHTGLHQVLAEALTDAWLDLAPAQQTDVVVLRKALWEQVAKPEFLAKLPEQNDLLLGFLMEQMMDLLEHPRT
jgi:hypothetical protein